MVYRLVTFSQVKDKIFRKEDSGNEFGTVTWGMNVTHSSNAKMGPKKNYNAYRNYTDMETDAQIIVMSMDYFNMTDINGMNLCYWHILQKAGIGAISPKAGLIS